jgi:hypothetical protein
LKNHKDTVAGPPTNAESAKASVSGAQLIEPQMAAPETPRTP